MAPIWIARAKCRLKLYLKPDGMPLALTSFREQAGALAVMPVHLKKITAAAPEAEEMPSQRIPAKYLLHL